MRVLAFCILLWFHFWSRSIYSAKHSEWKMRHPPKCIPLAYAFICFIYIMSSSSNYHNKDLMSSGETAQRPKFKLDGSQIRSNIETTVRCWQLDEMQLMWQRNHQRGAKITAKGWKSNMITHVAAQYDSLLVVFHIFKNECINICKSNL